MQQDILSPTGRIHQLQRSSVVTTVETTTDDNHNRTMMDDKERMVRNMTKHNRFYLLFVNTYSSVAIFATHLISLECMLSMGLSIYFTIYTYNRLLETYNHDTVIISEYFDGNVMNWILLSFAVITPITSSVAMAFRRREQALQNMMMLRSCVTQIYVAHCTWDFEYKRNVVVTKQTNNDEVTTTTVTTGRQRVSFFLFAFQRCGFDLHQITKKLWRQLIEYCQPFLFFVLWKLVSHCSR